MIKVILVICILLLGKFLEQWKRENSRIFWSGIILLAMTFSSSDELQFQTIKTPTIVEKNTASILAINPGGERVEMEIWYFRFRNCLRKKKKI